MAEARFESFDLTMRRRNPWFGLAALALMTAVPALLLAFATSFGIFLGVAPLAVFLGLALWNANLSPRERLGRLDVGDLGLFYDHKRLCARSDVRDGSLLTDGADAPIVRLKTKRGTFDLRVENLATGRRLLRAVGTDTAAGGTTIRLSSRVATDPARLAFVGMLALLVVALFPAMGYAWLNHPEAFLMLAAACGLAVIVVMSALFSSTTVALSANGVHLRWLLRRRTIAFADIDAVRLFDDRPGVFGEQRQRGIAIHLRNGDVLRLPDSPNSTTDLGAIVERIRAALARNGRGEVVADEALLGSRGRSPSEWLRAVRALGNGANADHRTAPVRPETLWRIVEDATAEPDARAGAAVALRERLDDEGRMRMRIAALNAASPGLRFALEAAATEGDDAELEHALGELGHRTARA